MAFVDLVAQLTDAQRTRRVFRYLALFALQTVKHLLLIAIASRQYLNLIHWLPVILSLQRTIFFPSGDEDGRESSKEDRANAYELVQPSEVEVEERAEQTCLSDASISKVNTALHATSDLFLYWSYVKIPARIIIISSALPYAFAILAEILNIVQSRAPYTITSQFKTILAGVVTIILTGTGVFWSEKQDSYAFLHLVVAIGLKTVLMLPKESAPVQHFVLRICQKISSWSSLHLSTASNIVARRIPTSYAPTVYTLVRRIFHRFATPHFATTVILFLADFLLQLPKRWSFFSSRCWSLAIGILVTEALIRYLEGSLHSDDAQIGGDFTESNKPSSGDEEIATADDHHFRNTIRLASESCLISFLALLIASTSSASIDITASNASSPLYIAQSDRNAKIVHFMLMILLCWLVVWVSTALGSGQQGDHAATKRDAENESARRNVLGERRLKLFIAVLGLLPLVLAVGKHTMSGTMLGKLHYHHDQINLREDASSVISMYGDMNPTKYSSPALVGRESDLPTVDVVIAYYNEPTSALRRLISGLRKELTWAQVNVIIYHDGIQGFDGSQFAPLVTSDTVGPEVTMKEVLMIAGKLLADTGADVVVPRKNVGRDMGVFLDHIIKHWEGLAHQTIFLQADVHEPAMLWQRLRLLRADVGYMSFAHYGLFADPLDLLNDYPFPEMSIAWDLFHPGTPLPKTPILTAYRGQMVISRDRIKRTEKEAWEHTIRILISERDDPIHVDGFGWKGEEEG